MNATPLNTRRIMAALAVVVGLFMVAVAPFIIQTSLERVLAALQEVVVDRPAFGSGILLFSFAYPFYRALIFIGGVHFDPVGRPHHQRRRMGIPNRIIGSCLPLSGWYVHVSALRLMGRRLPSPDGDLIRWVGIFLELYLPP
jgi:hypothetical protein